LHESKLRSVLTLAVAISPNVPPDRALRLATKRNDTRLQVADEQDQQVLRKYLPVHVSSFLPAPVAGPDDSHEPPLSFLHNLRQVAAASVPTPAAPPFQFDTSDSALRHNEALLRAAHFNLEALLSTHQNTTLGYGSEFRPVEQLRSILGSHPHFTALEVILRNGMDYRFHTQLSEPERTAELTEMINRGNHKSADDEPSVVNKLLLKDVTHGFSLPLPPETIARIRGALVQPLGLAKQWSLNQHGGRIPKYRLTQDLSFSISQDACSVNDRIDMKQYAEMIYGWCLGRILHFIAALRLAHPRQRIFIAKYDYSDAYRRIAHSGTAAAQSISIFDNVAYVALRLTFGGSPNPPTWCLFSEMVTDLANEIYCCSPWDPTDLHSPAQPETPTPRSLPPDVAFENAMPMAVVVPVTITARTDGFIDDLIQVFLDTPDNVKRAPHAVPLAIHVTSRPHAGPSEPIQRRSLLSDVKLIAEGTPEEIQAVLGWSIDTRRLLLSLPTDKFDAWMLDIKQISSAGKTTFGNLDTTVGRLNHAAYVIPLARHFLNRLRSRLLFRKPKTQEITLSRHESKDLALWRRFLIMAHDGLSINRLTIRQPTRLTFSDTCPFGFGGYNLQGRAWRIRIPHLCPLRGDGRFNNLFEFMGMAIGIWIECLAPSDDSECILSLGDNTSAVGWLFRSSHVDAASLTFDAIQLVARKVATLIMESPHCLASQHIKGKLNVVSDLLSFEKSDRGYLHPLAYDSPADDILTQRFHSHLPTQIPQGFNISPLPNEILSWITLVLQVGESSLTADKKRQTKIRTESGDAGEASAHEAASKLTPSSLLYAPTSKNSSCDPSSDSIARLNGLATVNLQEAVARPWSEALCEMPQAVWLRRSGTITGPAPCTTRAAHTCVLCSARSSEPTITKIPLRTDKKLSLPVSSAPSMTPPVQIPSPSATAHQA
jgi:hypothetical protein